MRSKYLSENAELAPKLRGQFEGHTKPGDEKLSVFAKMAILTER
jgi:hypothetical protein